MIDMYNPVVQKTTKNEVKVGIANSFSVMYLTTLSIIQGVVLGFWARFIPTDPKGWLVIFSPCGLKIALMCLTTLLIIIGLWHAYFWLAAIAKWTPLIWDSLYMFLIGAIELIVVKNIGSASWYYAVAILAIVGGTQYYYNVSRLPDESWDTDAKQIGEHICTYKSERGKALVLIGFVALIITIGVHNLYPKGLWIVAVLILGAQCWAIRQHIMDQKETLNRVGTLSV